MMFGAVRDRVRRIFGLGIHSQRLGRADAEAELRSYLAARTEHLMARGMTAADAQSEALRRLGGSFEHTLHDLERSAELREKRMSIRDAFDELCDDLRFALRGLRREKLVTTFIIATLALGIGANAAMFSVVDRLLIRGPEHIVDPGRVMRFYWMSHIEPRGDVTTNYFGWVSYGIFRKQSKVFDGAAAYAISSPGASFGDGPTAPVIPYGEATWDLFPLLGVRPEVGRFFTAQEDNPDAPQSVVVLGYGLWKRAFGSDRGVIGRTMTLGTNRYAIVGVAPRGFTGPQLGPVDAWVPLSLRSRDVTNNWQTAWNAQWLRIIARVRSGVTPEQAGAAATTAYRAAYTGTEEPYRRANIFIRPLGANRNGDESSEATISRWLIGVTLIVLLIACSNVANLLLARAVRRRQEVAVRIALGAGRGRLIRLLLTESGLLAFAGGVAGLAVAWGAALLLRNVLLPDVDWPTAPVDATVVGVSLLIAAGVGVLAGLVPAMRISRPDLTAALKAGARESGGHSSRLRSALTIAQAALSIVLLVGAGLFMRSLARVRAIDLGIEPDRVLVAQIRYSTPAGLFNPKTAPEAARRNEVLRQAIPRLRELSSVESASLTAGLPFQSSFGVFQRVAGWDSIPHLKGGDVNISAVADGYFATVGTRLLEGRAFGPTDRDGSEPVAIVSKTMATTLWPGKSPVGECIYWNAYSRDSLNTCSRIVGLVADAHSWALREDPHMQYYIPFGQERGFGGTSVLIRPRIGAEADAIVGVRALLIGMDPAISFVQARLLQDAVEPQVRPWKLGASIFSLMGLLALVVAAVGLYSVMSYLVAQRRREIGVRIALGAQGHAIVAMVLRNGVGMAFVGVALGTGIALWAGRFIAPLLFDTSPRDPFVLGGVGAALLAIAVLASVVPAMRAKRVDPIEALRAE